MTSTGEEIDEIKDSGVDKALGYNGPTHKGAYLKAQIDQAVILDEAVDQTVIQELYQERQTGDGGSGDEEEGLTGQVLDLEFEDNLTDGTGKNTDIQISGSGYSYVDGQNSGKALSLNGANTYVDLGNNTELQPDKLTLSFWIKPNGDWGSGEQVIAWNKNEYTTDGWYLSSENAETPLALSAGPGAGQPYKISVKGDRAEFFPVDEWTHIVVTYDSETKEAAIYRNGLPQDTVKENLGGDSTGVIGADETMEKSIGYNDPVYNGSYLNASLDHYELWNDVATAEEAVTLYEEQGGEINKKQVAQEDLDALVLPAETSSNIYLPSVGEKGSVITWSVKEGTAMDKDGVVTRPAQGEPDAKVTLTASASYRNGEAVTEDFQITVLALKEVYLYNNGMDHVTLTDDYLENAESKDVDYLLSMTSEKFLYEFYKVAGLEPTTDSGYAGWERSNDANFRGHFFGHYMSALSQAYLGCKDESTKAALLEQIEDAVNGLEKCQDAYAGKYRESAGYISAFPEGVLERIDGVDSPTADDTLVIVPYYNLHKVLAGLLDISKNVQGETGDKALEIAQGFGDYLYNRMQKLTDKNRMLGTEYGGMNEALYELYNLSGEEKYKETAEYFDETSLFEQLAVGNDVLSGKHANTTIPKLIGAAKRYQVLTSERFEGEVTAEDKENLDMYLTAAENFWEIVTEHHSYVTGGNSQSEHFHDADTQADYADNVTCETCNTHNILKLSRILFQITGDKKYMDYYENTYINAILASQNPETGMMMYFQPMEAGYFKVYNSEYEDFWCCTGTGVENFTKLGDTIYLAMDGGVYVNMFFSSKYSADGLDLTMDANIPNEDTVTITVEGNENNTPVKVRKPDWAAGEITVTKNGETVTPAEDGGYMVFEGLEADDELTFTFPMEVKAYDLPDNKDMISFKYGPVVLCCGLGTNDLKKEQGAGILVRAPQADSTINTVVLVEDKTVDEWKAEAAQNLVRIEDSEDGLVQFKLQGTDRDDELVYSPYYAMHTQRYGIYMTFANTDSPILQDQILKEKQEARDEESSSDSIEVFDENNSELSHNLQKYGWTTVGAFGGRTYRDAGTAPTDGFSYDLKITPGVAKQYLLTTYTTADANRSFDILINGEPFVTETITNEAAAGGSNVFYTVRREIPEKYLTGDQVQKDDNGNPYITVKFQGNGTSPTGGLYGISVNTDYDTDPSLKSLTFDKGTLDKEFNPEVTEYTLTVPKGTDSVNLTAKTVKESGLVYIGDILFDNKLPRTVAVEESGTTIELTSYAQDHETSRVYTINIVWGDEPQPEPTLDEIKITGPTKTKYIQGEELDLSGLVVTAVYSDGSEVEIQVDDYTVSGYNSNVVGTQTITVTYEGKTATFSVTVEEDKQPTDPTDPTDPSKPTDPDQPSDTRGGKDQQTGGADQSTDGGDKSKTVQTGDTTNVAGTAAVCVIALGMAGAVIYIRRKRQ